MADFTHLHVHAEYSPLDAPIALDSLVEKAKKLGYKSLALTDHGTISGWVKYALACKKHGVRPIFGVEAYFVENRLERKRGNHHLILLAKNEDGLRNIGKITEQANADGYYYNPRADWDLLEKHHDGVIATSACVSGIIPETYIESGYDPAMRLTGRFRDIFGDDFYLEVQYHNLEIEKKAYDGVAKIAAANGIKIVGTNDVHYLEKNQASIQEAVMALNMKKCMKDPSRLQHSTNQFYLKSPDEMISFLGGQKSQAVMSTMEIAEKCQAEMVFGKPELPLVSLPSGFTDQMTFLEHLAKEGMQRIGKKGNSVYETRFNEELEVIKKLKDKGYDFDRYFLIVSEYCNWARRNGIWVGAGRGSACGSLIIYCLGITDIDPLPLDLLFERFLDETRNEMPDIDVDFDSRRQKDVYAHLCDLYGADHCARIGTFGTYHPASAIKAAFRVFDPGGDYEKEERQKKLSASTREKGKRAASQRNTQDKPSRSETNAMANAITSLIPKGQQGSKLVLARSRADKDHKCLYDEVPQINDQRRLNPEIFEFAEQIEGLVEKKGIHAAGVLITSRPTVELAPKQYVRDPNSTADESFATVYDMQDVERLGGIKFDLLSTKVLSVFCVCVNEIKKRGGWKYEWDLNNLPLDDAEVLKLFSRGDTLAIFQFESDGMQRVLRDMNANCFEDIVAANALYRPGPMDNIKYFVARKKGGRVTYPVPALESVLKPTYGIFVYQEQIIKAVRILAGFSGSEADKVRKAMGKKKIEILNQMKPKFISGCEKTGSCNSSQAASIWEGMEQFASYAFNKSMDENTLIPMTDGSYKKMSEVKKGDHVFCRTNSGERSETEVVEVHDHGVLRGLEITFDDGSKEVCSIQHKFLTEYGMRPLWMILKNDMEVVANEKDPKYLSVRTCNAKQTGVEKSQENVSSREGNFKAEQDKELDKGKRVHKEQPRGVSKKTFSGNEENKVVCKRETKTFDRYEETEQDKQGVLQSCSLTERKEDSGSCRHHQSTIRAPKEVENRESGEVRGDNKKGSVCCEKEHGRRVAVQKHFDEKEISARCSNKVCWKVEASGFRPRASLDRGRWLLAFRNEVPQENQVRRIPCSRKGRDVVSGGGTARSNLGEVGAFLLEGLRKKNSSRGVDCGFENAPSKEAPRGLALRRIVSVRDVGQRHMLDLEVSSECHNFELSNGVITSNSHAAAYSKIAYQCAFLKTYHPVEYMAAQMSIEGEFEAFDTVALYERGARNMGIQLRPLDVNRSKAYYTIESDGKTDYIRRGFLGTKGIGSTSASNIVAGQPYKDVFDYCMRSERGVQRNVVDSLVKDGAFDCFKPALAKRLGKATITNADLMAEFDDKSRRAEKEKRVTGARKEEREGIGSIFGSDGDGIADGFAL